MNFEYMPELTWKWSYFVVLGLMAIVAIGLILFFWRNGWLKRFYPTAPTDEKKSKNKRKFRLPRRRRKKSNQWSNVGWVQLPRNPTQIRSKVGPCEATAKPNTNHKGGLDQVRSIEHKT